MTQSTPLPALIIGGPPQSGKSVLSYSLTKALVARRVPHYLLRACPDGEGNWSQETSEPVVKRIRQKGDFTDHFMNELCDDLADRHLPLLLDVGGLISVEQKRILAYGTGAILLVSDQKTEDTDAWRTAFSAANLPLLADLTSTLTSSEQISDTGSPLAGTITGLRRGEVAGGLLFSLLCERVLAALTVNDQTLRAYHRQRAPAAAKWLEVDRIDRHGQPVAANSAWQPQDLPTLLATIPPSTPLAIYGRGPGWLSAALACHAYGAAVYVFDARLAWVPVPPLMTQATPSPRPIIWRALPQLGHHRLEMAVVNHYLDFGVLSTLTPPPLDPTSGVVLSGKVPNWLFCAIAPAYRHHPWVAVYQPQLGNAVVVHTNDVTHPIGTVVEAPALSSLAL